MVKTSLLSSLSGVGGVGGVGSVGSWVAQQTDCLCKSYERRVFIAHALKINLGIHHINLYGLYIFN